MFRKFFRRKAFDFFVEIGEVFDFEDVKRQLRRAVKDKLSFREDRDQIQLPQAFEALAGGKNDGAAFARQLMEQVEHLLCFCRVQAEQRLIHTKQRRAGQ